MYPCSVAQLCLTLWPHGLSPSSLLCPLNFPGKNVGVGCYFLLQGIFLTQGLSPALQANTLSLRHLGSLGKSIEISKTLLSRQTLPTVWHSESHEHHSTVWPWGEVGIPTSPDDHCFQKLPDYFILVKCTKEIIGFGGEWRSMRLRFYADHFFLVLAEIQRVPNTGYVLIQVSF